MNATLVVGSNGFLGSLVMAALLVDKKRPLLAPVRATTSVEGYWERLQQALYDMGVMERDVRELQSLVTLTELPPLGQFDNLDRYAASMNVDEIVHCAGCVDYFDTRRLQLANIDLTKALIDVGRRWNTQRFVFLSTAYCSGYGSEEIPEHLHADPDPVNEVTAYTRSKRAAEWHIAESGLPFLIVRPSVVIGDSRTGVYRGKNYGLYQMWRAWEGLLGQHYSPVWYTVAPHSRLNFVHQDAFQTGFIEMYRNAPSNSVLHLVSAFGPSPTMRDMCLLWAPVYRPSEIRCYATVEDVPLATLPIRQRRFLELVAKNLEIATHNWRFESRYLDSLRAGGLHFPDATLNTIARCQHRYVASSDKIQKHLKQIPPRLDPPWFREFAPNIAALEV